MAFRIKKIQASDRFQSVTATTKLYVFRNFVALKFAHLLALNYTFNLLIKPLCF
jgi:hypothetical protein